MTREEFAKFYAVVSEYHEKEVSTTKMEIYFGDLKKYSLDDLSGAWHIHRKSSNFFPGVADFVKHLEPDTKQAAALAWSELLKLIADKGPYDSLRFTGEAALMGHLIIRLGGWQKLCEMSVKDFDYIRPQFITMFEAGYHAKHADVYIAGIHELDNARNGYKVSPKAIDVGGKLTKLIAGAAYMKQLPAAPVLTLVGGDIPDPFDGGKD